MNNIKFYVITKFDAVEGYLVKITTLYRLYVGWALGHALTCWSNLASDTDVETLFFYAIKEWEIMREHS